MTQLLLALLLILALVLVASAAWDHFIKPHISQKEFHMITQDEQAIVDAIRGVLSTKASLEQQVASEKARADAAESALAAEKADHADLVSQLQSVISPAPAPADPPAS